MPYDVTTDFTGLSRPLFSIKSHMILELEGTLLGEWIDLRMLEQTQKRRRVMLTVHEGSMGL